MDDKRNSMQHLIILFLLLFSFPTLATDKRDVNKKREFAREFWERKAHERNIAIAKTAASAVLIGGGLKLAHYFGGDVVMGIGLGSFLSQTQTWIGSLTANLTLYTQFEGIIPKNTLDQLKTLDLLELEYELRKSFYNEGQRNRIEGKLYQLKTSIESSLVSSNQIKDNGMNNDDEKLAILKLALSLPIETKAIHPDPEMLSDLKEYLRTFEPSIQSSILQYITQIQDDANASDALDGPGKSVFYFLGPPGTGKTMTAKMMAKILKLPFCTIKLAGFRPGHLNGSEWTSSGRKPGRIAECLGKPQLDNQTYQNTVIFLDEVHEILNADEWRAREFTAMLKDLLEPDQKTFYDEALELEVDISHTIFILAGNDELKEKSADHSFRQRFTTLTFPRVSQKNRQEIANAIKLKVAQRYQYPLQPEDDDIISNLASIDPNEGVRVLKKVIREYISFQKMQLDKKEWNKDDFLVEVPQTFDIKKSFMRNGSIDF